MPRAPADQGKPERPPDDASAPIPRGHPDHLRVTPDNVLTLAEGFRKATDLLDTAFCNVWFDVRLPADTFLGDPYSEWAVNVLNGHLIDGENSLLEAVRQLTQEHKRVFNALKAAADGYGKTDEWNARNLGDEYTLP